MALRTQLFNMLPWVGGVNTSVDKSMIGPNELVRGDNLIMAERASKQIREGVNQDWDDQSNSTASIIGLHDFWYGSASRTQIYVGVASNKALYSYSTSGTRSADLFGGTAWGSSITTCSIITFNNQVILAVDGASNVMKKWTGSGNFADLGGTPPEASIVREHLGRVWCNDKTNLDRLHYSTTANAEEWNGAGDSGALDIGTGDGDPEGITAIFPSFKGTLFVAKKTKLYRVTGDSPENFLVELVSSGIGCASHNSVALIDQDDMFFVSEKGIHSLAATDKFGDFEGAYVSKSIQKSFNDDFVKSRLRYSQGCYLSTKNIYLIAVTDDTYSASENNCVWSYNIADKTWNRLFPNMSCQAMQVFRESTGPRVFLGSSVTRVYRTFTGVKYDVNTSGTNVYIPMVISTGTVYPDGNPFTMKSFRGFGLYYKTQGNHTITVSVKIDNYETQSLAFTNTTSSDLLGTTFVLGTSILGQDDVMAPVVLPIDGLGRGIQITIEQAGVLSEADVEIQGYCLLYEMAETRQQVVTAGQSTP